MQRIQQKLQGRQTLLSVDDGALLKIARRGGKLLQDYGTKEMRCLRGIRRLQQACGDTLQVLPERLPLQFLVPHVRTLEERNQQTLRLHEDGLRGSNLGIHRGQNSSCYSIFL